MKNPILHWIIYTPFNLNKGENMSLNNEELKQKKKELAKLKRKVVELAGVMHDIVEDTIWVDYDKLPKLSEEIGLAMQKVNAFLEAYPDLKK
jgi:NADH:ubiquinone oxidoreductase subunit E